MQAALYINLVPIFGVTSATLLVGEPLRPSLLVGGFLVVVAITMVNPPDWNALPWRRRAPRVAGGSAEGEAP